ncbi:5'-methylthioadenosine/S-adenosylhomocysteine nucleosidase-like isoform X3 [Xenia sp. Carnegie-2017]|uniref:5'-methylthioadenosine/S-adenosylhomocysteine nucleosidase-like isoform X3 n=1 Tax=Xenia sp. Carnegie-2017 TaxID=2897299 RepID=UPI001F0383A3|nr:5'-methylthioadenosine/S-adenosylhomocysteine nucleosidase-like isoform X3 [Xenia sp. Carnegie-2017]
MISMNAENMDESGSNNNNIPSPPKLNIKLPSFRNIGTERIDWSYFESELPTDLLLVTAVDCEFLSCYYYMENIKRTWYHGLGDVDFGNFGNGQVKVALVQCNQGAAGAGAALDVVKDAVNILKPKAVACVGCCGMVNPKKAKLGDVLISTKLATYASKKISADGEEEWRGIQTNVSKNMGDLIRSADRGWDPPVEDERDKESVTVHKHSVMLSGPELVNNLERRQTLLKKFPEAIALEMEGEGLYTAAYSAGIEWVVVKGISDLANGSKGNEGDAKWQPFACAMAASVVHNMFKDPTVIKQWRNYEKQSAMSAAVIPAASTSPTPFLPIEHFLRSISGTKDGKARS